MTQLRRVAIVGGNRIPFARSNTVYATASNQEMLTSALEGLVERYNLHGERLGEVVAGAVLKHSRDFNLTRECVLGSRLAPETPAYDIQQACGTGLEAAILVANKIALGQIDSGIAGGVDTTSDAPIGVNEGLRKILLEANRGKSNLDKLKSLLKIRPRHVVPAIPRNGEPRTGLSMGESCELMAQTWQIPRDEQDRLAFESHHKLAAAYEEGWQNDLMTPFRGLTRDQNLRPDIDLEKIGTLKPVFERGSRGTRHPHGGQLDAADRRRLGGTAGQRGVGEGARPADPGLLQGRRGGGGELRRSPGGPADGAGLRGAAAAGTQRPEPAGLRLLRDP